MQRQKERQFIQAASFGLAVILLAALAPYASAEIAPAGILQLNDHDDRQDHDSKKSDQQSRDQQNSHTHDYHFKHYTISQTKSHSSSDDETKSNENNNNATSENNVNYSQVNDHSDNTGSHSLSFSSFDIHASGMAVDRLQNLSILRAYLNLTGKVLDTDGNRAVANLTGNLALGSQEYSINAWGYIMLRHVSPFTDGLLHVRGKAVNEAGGKPVVFATRMLILPSAGNNANVLEVIGSPAATVGHNIRIFAITGQLDLQGTSSSNPSTLDHFEVSNISSPQAAGQPFNVTVTAIDNNGSVLADYNGITKVTDDTGSVAPSTTSTFKDGIWTGQVNITKAAGNDSLKFTDVSTGKSGTSNTFSVFAGPLAYIQLSPPDIALSPGSTTGLAASGFDRFDNELSGLTFAWSQSPQSIGTLVVSSSTTSANFTASHAITSSVNGTIVAAVGPVQGKAQVHIVPESSQMLDHFVFAPIGTQVAGTPFSIKVTAVNSTGGAVPYSGPLRLIDSTGSVNATISSGFSAGSWTGTLNITKASTSVTIVAKDMTSGKSGTSDSFEVKAGALDHFVISSISNQTAGRQFVFNVTAVDSFGNKKADYAGNVTLTTNDGSSPTGNASSIIPSRYNFTMADAGSHSFAATLYNAADGIMIAATDPASGKHGTSNSFDVLPAAVAKVEVSPQSASVVSGNTAIFGAKAFDGFGNQIAGSRFNWSLNSTSIAALVPSTDTSSVTLTADAVSLPVTAKVIATVISTPISGYALVTVTS